MGGTNTGTRVLCFLFSYTKVSSLTWLISSQDFTAGLAHFYVNEHWSPTVTYDGVPRLGGELPSFILSVRVKTYWIKRSKEIERLSITTIPHYRIIYAIWRQSLCSNASLRISLAIGFTSRLASSLEPSGSCTSNRRSLIRLNRENIPARIERYIG